MKSVDLIPTTRGNAIPFNAFARRDDLGPWMAQIIGADEKYGLAREFLSKAPRREANGAVCTLNAGDVIEVNAPQSRGHVERLYYRVTVVDGTHIELEELATPVEALRAVQQ